MAAAPQLRERLLGLASEDERVRALLAADGSLSRGYSADMRAVHERNAAALSDMIDAHGWPGFRLADRDGAAAAWRIAQHAIALPAFQRRCLKLLAEAADAGDADPQHVAYLDDRIAYNERRPRRYGTQFDWSEDGEMAPWRVDDIDAIEARRRALGMRPFAEDVRSMRETWRGESDRAPADWHARQREIEAWAREVGWIA